MSDTSATPSSPPRWAELRRVGPLYRRYRWSYLFGLAAILAAVALRISVPSIFGQSIDKLREAEGSPAGELVSLAAKGAFAIGIVAVLGAIVRTASRLLVLGTSRRAVHDVRTQVMQRWSHFRPPISRGSKPARSCRVQ